MLHKKLSEDFNILKALENLAEFELSVTLPLAEHDKSLQCIALLQRSTQQHILNYKNNFSNLAEFASSDSAPRWAMQCSALHRTAGHSSGLYIFKI
jgi:hypothetical protein